MALSLFRQDMKKAFGAFLEKEERQRPFNYWLERDWIESMDNAIYPAGIHYLLLTERYTWIIRTVASHALESIRFDIIGSMLCTTEDD